MNVLYSNLLYDTCSNRPTGTMYHVPNLPDTEELELYSTTTEDLFCVHFKLSIQMKRGVLGDFRALIKYPKGSRILEKCNTCCSSN